MMEGGCQQGSVLLKEGEACGVLDDLQKRWPVKKQHVPGLLNGQNRLRHVWVVTFGTSQPAALAPAVNFARATAPSFRDSSETVVLRCCAFKGFAEEKAFAAIHKKPGTAARAWWSKVAPLAINAFIDSWGWQSHDSTQVRGLVRMTKDAAKQALYSSGCWAQDVALLESLTRFFFFFFYTCARCQKWWTGGPGPCPRTIFFARGPLSGVRLVRGCAFPSSGPWPCSKNAWMRSKCRGFTSSWQTASDIAQLQTPRVRKKLDELPIFKKPIST